MFFSFKYSYWDYVDASTKTLFVMGYYICIYGLIHELNRGNISEIYSMDFHGIFSGNVTRGFRGDSEGIQ